jgi:uncharacterized protein (TIGR01777 family)
MKIVIAGGTGFLGAPLTARLVSDGHHVTVLTRGTAVVSPPGGARLVSWTPGGDGGPWVSEIDGAGAIVNLAGEPIAAARWTEARKQRILESRVQATRSLVDAIRRAGTPPPVFISGSAVGYYGPCGDEVVTEESAPGSDFLARTCVRWEAEANRAAGARTRVTIIRTGIVLEQGGGALPPMLPPFKFGVGGPVGSGRQYWPWIHRTDWIDLVCWTLRMSAASGAVNATAPMPVTSADFAHALGRALHRPSFMPAPGFMLKLLLGEMAGALLLSGQRAVPAKAERLGFAFRYAKLDPALAAIFARSA